VSLPRFRLLRVTTFERVDYVDPRAVELRRLMDVEMSARYEMGSFPAEQMAGIEAALAVDPASITATVLVFTDAATPVAHAALRPHGDEWEVKRVIVLDTVRGQGIGQALMNELERIALAAGVKRLILQTGDRQPDAVRLYERIGYTPIPAYEPYASVIPQSLCFEKLLD
jgi:GNAT superfamily N-acetyltransferase